MGQTLSLPPSRPFIETVGARDWHDSQSGAVATTKRTGIFNFSKLFNLVAASLQVRPRATSRTQFFALSTSYPPYLRVHLDRAIAFSTPAQL